MLLTQRQWTILSEALDLFKTTIETGTQVTVEEIDALKHTLDPRGEFKPDEPFLVIQFVGYSNDHYFAITKKAIKEAVGDGKGITSDEDYETKVNTLLAGSVPCDVHSSSEEDATLVNDRMNNEEAWDDFLDQLAGCDGFEFLEARA